VSALRTTTSVRGEPVESEMGYVVEKALAGKRSVEIPAILDGEGLATEVLFANPGDSASTSTFRFFTPDGKPGEIIMR
jgi:hypothetical protein